MLCRRPHPYHVWEDYRAGMYDQSPTPDLHTALACDLLGGDPGILNAAMSSAVVAWPLATEHRLTASDTNRRAWLGAAACWMVGQCPEHATRAGWWRLTGRQRARANREANDVIGRWETDRSGVVPLFVVPARNRNGVRCA
jgi:hypothetical protein